MTEAVFGSPAGQVLVVGASGGIGLAFVRGLLALPGVERLYAACRQPEQAIELQAMSQQDQRLQLLTIDLTDDTSIAQAVAEIQSTTDRLHCVINCVGVLHDETVQPEKSLRQIDGDRMLHYFQVNSIGAVLLAKQVQPLLKHNQLSVLATISAKVGSIGDNALGGWYGYRASKAALNMLMKTTAIEYQRTCPKAIVAVFHPGTTATALSAPFQRNVPPEKLFTPEKTVDYLLDVMGQLKPTDSGEFFSWNGDRLPW
jgi:NAD(P)-dependent dehydrogenase (short-subunit alcohol dehydrogenase family)